MKNLTISRMTFGLLCGAGLLAATTGWSAPLQVTLYAKVVWINPITGSAAATQGAASLGRIPMWGFTTSATGAATVPGTQINVPPGNFADGLEITVSNMLSVPVSLVIPGLNTSPDLGQPASFAGDPNYGDRIRSLAPEVAPGTSRLYKWTNLKPGTFVYHSGTHPAVQVQMGLFGMVTIKSTANEAYPGVLISTAGGERSLIFSEVDPVLHWAVHTNGYGPGKAISSTIHSEPSLFLINGLAYNPNGTTPLLTQMQQTYRTLFRMINVGWDSHIPALSGPYPSGGENYLKVVAEDGEPYEYPKTLYAPNLAALKTMDVQFIPPSGGNPDAYQVYDRKLGLANGGGMFRKVNAAVPVTPCAPAVITGQPVSVTTNHLTGPVRFTVAATGSELVYQWFRGATPISNSGGFSGATTATLTIAAVAVTNGNAGDYSVVVASRGCGDPVASVPARLEVRPIFTRSVFASRSNATGTNGLTSPSITINGINKLLVVAVTYRDVANGSPSIASVNTVPTVGSPQAFTQLASGQWNDVDGKLDLWYLVAPSDAAAGACPVRVNFAPGTTMEQVAVVVDLFNGVNQTTPFGPALTDYLAGAKASISLSPVSATSDLVVNWLGYNNAGVVVGNGPGQTTRGAAVNTSLSGTSASVRVTSKVGDSGTTSMTATFSPGTAASMGAVAIKP